MATISLAQASLRSQNQLERGIINSLIKAQPALAAFPITQVYGNALAYNRLVSDITAQAVAADGTITDSAAMVIKQITATIGTMSGQGDVPNIMLRQGIGGGEELKAQVLESAARALANAWLTYMITGTVAANGFDGLQTIMADADFAGQVVDAANAAFDLSFVDDASSRVLVPGQKFIMGNAKVETKLKQVYRNLGGATPTEIDGRYFQSYDGMLFLRNDNIPTDKVGGTAGNQTDIYVMTLGDGLINEGAVNLVTTPGELFHIEEFDYLEMKSAYRGRVLMDMGLTVGNPQSIAVVKNVTV